MQSKWMGRIGLSALVLGVVGGSGTVSGCAAERDPINRVQAAVVDKSFFLGASLDDYSDDPEFRTKSYNIDSAANTDSYSGTIGGATAVDRIRWEVTENYLFARRSYQESPGADNRGLAREKNKDGKWVFPTKPTGSIIAAFKIDKHFDVRRDYNSQTGEEANVIVENDSDRPWQQRQFMRVNWSKNEAQSTSGDTTWVFGEGTKAAPIEYNASNENDEDRPRFEPDTGYFDVTNKYQITPEVMPMFGVPECVIVGFFNGGSSFDCTPTEVKVRHSFVRLTGDEDFEPFEESFAQRDIVGNWGNAGNSFNREYGAPPTTTWDPQYGYTDAKTKTFYSFHNIWAKSHQDKACSSNVDDDKDGTADECANATTLYKGSRGSQCDLHAVGGGRCTIPVRDREVQTIGYWLNAEAPTELQDEVAADGKTITRPGSLEEMTITWDQLLKVAVATRREVECRRTGDGDREGCHDQFFAGTGPESKQMVAFGGWGVDTPKEQAVDKKRPLMVTCHNPVRNYDDATCGQPGENIRLGDLRKNYAIYWPYASRAPYGGVATIGADPLTGEMLGVTATTMMRSATAAAAQQRDIIQLALGDLKVEELIEGAQASRYADVVKNGKVNEGLSKAKTPEQLKAAVDAIDLDSVHGAVAPLASAKNVGDVKQLNGRQIRQQKARSQVANIKYKAGLASRTPNMQADDDRLETMVKQMNQLSADAKVAVGNRSLQQVLAQAKDKNPAVFTAINNFVSQDPSKLQDIMDRYQRYLGTRGMCFSDQTASAGAGSIYQPSLAPYYRTLYGSLDAKERGVKIYHDLLRESVKGIAFHEIGHSIGMRHNFASSWDSLNYQPQYWQLRTNEGQATQACTGPRNGGADNCMGPRYLDPMTDDEQGLAGEARPGIEYFGNTSTMEYQIERFGETAGAGTYDLHFLKTLYGRSLETFDAGQISPSEQSLFGAKMLSQGIPDELIYSDGFGVHYTEQARLAKVFDPARDCRDATDQEKAAAKWRIVHGKVCSQPPKNVLAYQDMVSSEIGFDLDGLGNVTPIGADGVRWQGTDENGTKLVRWPFRYGEDYSRGGYIHAKPGDSGADIYEITVNLGKRFDLTYPWQYFRRQNKEFAWWAIPSSVGGNYWARLRGYHWNTTTDIGRAAPADLTNDNQTRPAVMASNEMFNILQRAILMPEPGVYIAGAGSKRRTAKRAGAAIIFDLPEGNETADRPVATVGIIDSRYVQIEFDNGRGGSWDYQEFPQHVGFDEEKVLAIRELVDSRPTLSTISRENALDGRDPYISFRTDVPHALDRLVGSLMSDDWESIAPSAVGSDNTQLTGFSILDKDAAKLVRPAESSILFPNMGYSNQLGTGIYAMLFSRFSTDMVLFNKMRIRAEGDAGYVPPVARQAAFTDPATGIRYMAAKYGTETIMGRAVERGVASRMMQRANELAALVYATTGVVSPAGEVTYDLNADGSPKVIGKPADELILRRYVGYLDAVRQVSKIFGGGPLGGGGGDGDE